MTVMQRNVLWAATTLLGLILGLSALFYVGYAFRMATWVFLVLWILVPCMAWVMNDDRVAVLLSEAHLKRIRVYLMLASMTIALLVLANWEHFRDRFGQAHIDGYSVQYRPDYDEFGRPDRTAEVSTEKWYARVGLWLGELILVVACVGIPILTWKGITQAVEKRNEGSQCA